MGGAPAKVKQILGRIDEAIREVTKEVRTYIKKNTGFEEIGDRMLKEWEAGATFSLRPA